LKQVSEVADRPEWGVFGPDVSAPSPLSREFSLQGMSEELEIYYHDQVLKKILTAYKIVGGRFEV